jgi:putative hydrolase of the HAD superfamily
MPSQALFPIDWKQLDHIVLDFGGVLYELDYDRTIHAFARLGLDNFGERFNPKLQDTLFDSLECGEISEEDFLNSLKNHCSPETEVEDVRKAWNAMLLGLRPNALPWLESLGQYFDLLLFSNTNAIHASHFEQDILGTKGRRFSESFRQIIYSHRLGLRKPETEAFVQVATQFELNPEKTLFIDDNKGNVAGAISAGWSAVHFDILHHSLPRFLRGIGYEDFLND